MMSSFYNVFRIATDTSKNKYDVQILKHMFLKLFYISLYHTIALHL